MMEGVFHLKWEMSFWLYTVMFSLLLNTGGKGGGG